MKKSLSGIIVVIAALLPGCCDEDEYIYIPEENKILYELHDTLVYKSNEGELDTFFVSDTLQWFNEALNYDYCGTATYREGFAFEFEVYPVNSDKEFYIQYFVNEVAMKWYSSHFGTMLSNTPEMDSLVIDDKTYYGIYREESSEDTATVQTIYFHRKYGIVKYEDIRDKSWFLFKILKNNEQ